MSVTGASKKAIKARRVGASHSVTKTDRVPDPKWGFWAQGAMGRRSGKCDVYWGMHACALEPGHNVDGEAHECFCGAKPYESSVWWGNGLTEAERAELPARYKRIRVTEELFARAETAVAKVTVAKKTKAWPGKRKCGICGKEHGKRARPYHERPCDVCKSGEHTGCQHKQDIRPTVRDKG